MFADNSLQTGVPRNDRIGGVTLPLLAGLLCLSALAIAAMQSLTGAVVVLASVAAAALVIGVLVFAQGRLTDLALIGFMALITIPLDKFFGYQEHVGGWPGLRVAIADGPLMLMALLAPLGWFVGRVRNGVPRSVFLIYLLLIAQEAFSATVASNRELAAFEFAASLHAFAICFLIAALFRRGHTTALLIVLALTVAIHSGFAIAQVGLGRPIGASWFGGTQEVMQEVLVTGTVRLRPSGLFDHPIVFADFLMITIPVLVAGAYATRRRPLSRAMVTATGIALLGLALTLSRGAWISTAIALVLVFALARRHSLVSAAHVRRLVGRTLVVIVPAALALGPYVAGRMLYSRPGNLEVRFELNQIAFAMIGANPLTGVGLNNFLVAMERYDPTNVMKYFPATVHNMYLLQGAETGLLGLLLFTLLFAAIVTLSLRRLSRLQDEAMQWLAIGLLAGLMGFLVSQFADFSYRLEPLRSTLWADIGLLFGTLRYGRGKRHTEDSTGIDTL